MRAIICHLIEDLLRGLSGPLGYRLRQAWYRRTLLRCGTNLRIEPGVHIVGANHIMIGDNVWLDRGVTLIAGKPRETVRIIGDKFTDGLLEIGSNSHVGIQTVIQAHGGVRIGDCFTTSAGVKIYSFSNDPAECLSGTMEFGQNKPGYRVTPVRIGRNVWLGLDSLVVGASIGDNCFLRPKTLVTGSIPAGCTIRGPAAEFWAPRFSKSGLKRVDES